jgi:very-short-patch-repair endonuclease
MPLWGSRPFARLEEEDALHRARDRLVLLRSVKREDLNENDLKARLIAHFENPMPLESQGVDNGLSACESHFEHDMMQRLLDRGYRVQAQVGSLGYRIDLVVAGDNRYRLAIECDGDRFHGPEQWREDMRRQRVLERVGWRFWRCFASSFYQDPDRTIGDLYETLYPMGIYETLYPMGIEPVPRQGDGTSSRRFTEHRVIDGSLERNPDEPESEGPKYEIGLGDQMTLQFADDPRRISA